MEDVKITITGTMPLLMHADNIDWADLMKKWSEKPENKRRSTAGDDRSPAFRWIGCLYHDQGVVTVPSEYLASCAMKGAAEVPTGKRGKSFKELSQSALLWADLHYPLLVGGKGIPIAKIEKGMELETFPEHEALAVELGFVLFKKRARVGMSKHIRVRPRFDNWSLVARAHLVNKQLTKEVLQTIMDEAGRLKGLGDWRPGGKTPGPFGTFKALVE